MSLIVQFLEKQQAALNELILKLDQSALDVSSELILVLGNEACDLDSMVSALLWSYYQQSQLNNNNNISKLYLPILSIPKNELKLRKEAIYLFNQIDLSLINKLFFIDTIPLNKILLNAKNSDNNNIDQKDNNLTNFELQLSVHLVDHNALSISLNPILGNYVNYIIDHHVDEGLYSDKCTINNGNRNIITVGSNVSFIIHLILLLNNNYDISRLSEFAALINGVILLDTMCFNKNVNKTTDIDIKIYKLFQKYVHNNNCNESEWYKLLLNLRINIDGFTFSELLLKDFKIFQENNIIFGIPAFGLSLQNLIKMENDNNCNIFEDMFSFQKEKKLNIVVAQTIFFENNFTNRQLALFTDNQMLFNHVNNGLQLNQNKLFLGLQSLKIDQYISPSKTPLYYQWWNLDVKISRKKLTPVMRQILKSFKL